MKSTRMRSNNTAAPAGFDFALNLFAQLLCALAILVPITSQTVEAETGPIRFAAPSGTGGAVASGEAQATQAGLGILRSGGNAADAAVATALALAVTFPEAGNLGGGGFAVVRFGEEVASLDFREVAPLGATETMYLDADGNPRPNASTVGPLAAGVPGSPFGLYALHQRFGKLPWAEVVEPARRLADEGFRISQPTFDSLDDEVELLRRFPETAETWLSDGEAISVGATQRLPKLAQTLRAYGEKGPGVFRQGSIAEAIVASSDRHGGILTLEDLAEYVPSWRNPVLFEAFGFQFASMGLPSSGGAIVGQTLQVLEKLGWSEMEPGSTERDHLLVEVWRHVYADRFRLGDPTTSDVTAEALVAPDWIEKRTGEIDLKRAGDSDALMPITVTPPTEPQDTTHLSVVDRDGNMVALTTTLNGGFGCGLWVPEIGFLNNEMDDFNTAPGRPNLYGLVQGQANLVRPGKRMLSSMSPMIGWTDDRAIALGGRGGSRIPTATTQVLLHWLEDTPIQSALDARRIHHQWLPDEISVEEDARTKEEQDLLRSLGHTVTEKRRFARVHAITYSKDGRVSAAADPRGPGSAGVVRPRP